VLGLHRDKPGPLLGANDRRLVDALIDQTVVAVERAQLAQAVDETRILAETERLRGALLTSVSHDLRTPLATILGTISSLRSYGALYDDQTRDEMLAGAQEETERLSRFVANLLDMTRLDSGALEVKRDSIDLGDLVGAALQRAGKLLARHQVKLSIAPDLPMLRLDSVLAEQVLLNLLDNAAKYAPPRTTIEIRARRKGDAILLEVLDEGPGIPEPALERVFDKFYRAATADRQQAGTGTGLGLPICRGFVEAMGGRIKAMNREGRSGARIVIRFPASLAAPAAPD
jgi:two-component system sensor histidine kinase KdpD